MTAEELLETVRMLDADLELDDAGALVLVGTIDDPGLIDELRARRDELSAALAAQEPARTVLLAPEPTTPAGGRPAPTGTPCPDCGELLTGDTALEDHRRAVDTASRLRRAEHADRLIRSEAPPPPSSSAWLRIRW